MENYRNLFTLEGKSALVVGGTGGLGMPIARALMQNGADIAIAARKPEKAQALEQESKAEGRRYLGVRTDLLDADSVQRMADQVAECFGGIDILVNAAGMNVLKPAEDYDVETWDRVMDVNVKGLYLATKAVGRHMIARKYGRILNLSSVRSIIGMPRDYSAYCASKGAVNLYTKQIACEWARFGITCNAVAPTFTRTPINAFQLDDPAFYERLVARIPLGRIGTAHDLCAAAVYLCSDGAAFVTGQILGVDGGITAIQ